MKLKDLNTYLIFFLLAMGALNSFAQDKKARIDSHIHLYDTNRERSFSFLDGQRNNPNTGLFVPHLQQQFLNAAQPSGFDYTYVVEASTRREDNFWLSQIADTSDHVLGFTANLNPLHDTFVSDLDSLKKNPKFRGVRPRIRGLDLAAPEVLNKLVELDERNVVLEINRLEHANTIAEKYPNMPIIVNHFGSIRLKDGNISDEDNYKKSLKEIAAHKNVFMKISAMHVISGKNPAPTNLNYYKPLLDAAVDAFGPNRVIYGSNWPLSGLRGTYDNAVNILEQYCAVRSDLSEEQLFFKNILKAYGLPNPCIQKKLALNNDTLHLKLDLTRGGAISYISKSGSERNIVNIHDEGRYIQQSYYAGKRLNRQAEGQKPEWSPWSWNPIQVGDCYRNRAEIIEYSKEGNTLYVKCIPMLWDMKNKPAEAIMEQWTTLSGNVIKVSNRLTCQRTDDLYGEGISNKQELPAVYPISALKHLYAYFGEEPFTGAPLDKPEVENLRDGFWGRYQNDMVSENWMAFVNDDLWGMGVYTPICTNFLAGMAGDPGYEANDASTSYIAPVKKAVLNKNSVYAYDYYIIVGNLDEIRSDVYSISLKLKNTP